MFTIGLALIAVGIALFLLAKLFLSYPLVFLGFGCFVGSSVLAFLSGHLSLAIVWIVLSVIAVLGFVLNAYWNKRGAFWFSLGAVLGLIAAAYPYPEGNSLLLQLLPFAVPVGIFLVVGILGSLIFPRAKYKNKDERKHRTNTDVIIGKKVRISRVSQDGTSLRGFLGDVDWAIAPLFSYEKFKVGDLVVIQKIQGVTLYCSRDDKDYRLEIARKREEKRAEADLEARRKRAQAQADKAQARIDAEREKTRREEAEIQHKDELRKISDESKAQRKDKKRELKKIRKERREAEKARRAQYEKEKAEETKNSLEKANEDRLAKARANLEKANAAKALKAERAKRAAELRAQRAKHASELKAERAKHAAELRAQKREEKRELNKIRYERFEAENARKTQYAMEKAEETKNSLEKANEDRLAKARANLEKANAKKAEKARLAAEAKQEKEAKKGDVLKSKEEAKKAKALKETKKEEVVIKEKPHFERAPMNPETPYLVLSGVIFIICLVIIALCFIKALKGILLYFIVVFFILALAYLVAIFILEVRRTRNDSSAPYIEEETKEEIVVEQPEAPVAPEAPATPEVAPAPEAKKEKGEFVPFSVRMKEADPFLREAYNELKSEVLSYGIKSRVSSTSDRFRLHKKEYVKMVIAGQFLKLYFALDPEDYKDTTYPFDDAGRMGAHKDTPFVFKIKSGLSIRRAKQLINDVASKEGLVQGEVIPHDHAADLESLLPEDDDAE